MVHQPISGTGAAPRPNNLSENLMMAGIAVKYVKERMSLGAANKGADLFWHTTGLWTTEAGECLTAVRKDLKEYQDRANPSTFEQIRFNANRALLGGCGNCDEQAMAAFMFLYNNKVRPLDLMACPGVHVFVVLGRDGQSDENRVGTWGKDSAICDPWDDAYYPSILRPLIMSTIDVNQMLNTVCLHRAD